jgi:hypothetical protein
VSLPVWPSVSCRHPAFFSRWFPSLWYIRPLSSSVDRTVLAKLWCSDLDDGVLTPSKWIRFQQLSLESIVLFLGLLSRWECGSPSSPFLKCQFYSSSFLGMSIVLARACSLLLLPYLAIGIIHSFKPANFSEDLSVVISENECLSEWQDVGFKLWFEASLLLCIVMYIGATEIVSCSCAWMPPSNITKYTQGAFKHITKDC